MPRYPTQPESAGLQKSCTAALLDTGRDQLGRAGWISTVWRTQALSPSSLARASDRAMCVLSSSTSRQSPVLLYGSCFPSLAVERSPWHTLVDFIDKSAAECESETHSKRTQPPCGLQSNAEKILFWQDSHLLLCEGQGLVGGCL